MSPPAVCKDECGELIAGGKYGHIFDSIHNKGNSENFFDRADYQPRTGDSLHLDLFLARSWFQAPNTFDQAAAGQDQRQLMKSFNVAPGWTHLFGPSTLLTASAFVRQDRVQYYPSADLFSDQPETVSQGRRLTNTGFRFDVSHAKGKHNIKAGLQSSHTSLSENFRFGITDPTVNPVCLDGSGNPVLDPSITDPAACASSGFVSNPSLKPGLVPFDLTRNGTLLSFKDTGGINQQSVYVQDNITLGGLTANVGLRGDHYDGLTEKYMLEPRVGVAYRVTGTNTVLRGGYARTMETPYNENLLLSSAAGVGGLAVNVFDPTTAAEGTGPGLDSAKWQRFARNSLHRAYLHGMPAVFSLNVTHETIPEVLETPCLFCPNTVRYIIDFSLSVVSPKTGSLKQMLA